MCQIILPYSLLHVAWNLCMGIGWQVLSSPGHRPLLPFHATLPPLCGPLYFKQLDMEGHVCYSRVCAIISVWKFSTEFPTKMVNLNKLLLISH